MYYCSKCRAPVPYGVVECGNCRRQEQFLREARRDAEKLQQKQQEADRRLQRDAQDAAQRIQREQSSTSGQPPGRLPLIPTLVVFGVFLLLRYMGFIGGGNKSTNQPDSKPGALANHTNEKVPKKAGQISDAFASAEGNTPPLVLRVVNVKAGDYLSLREKPDSTTRLVYRIPPTASGIYLRGRPVNNDGTIWIPVEFRGEKGFVNSFYVQAINAAR